MTHGSGARVLVVDDEPAILRAVQTNLGRHDFRIETAANGQQALDAIGRVHPDLILLDLGLPDMDGLEVLQTIRKWANTPVVVLSARGAEQDKVLALNSGADDYLTKPFGINELLARVRVALRHAAGPAVGLEPVIKLGELEVNFERRRIAASGVQIHLTPTEWDLVKLFATNPDKVLTDRMIMESVWGAAYQAQAHSLHVYVGRLRKKLEAPLGAKRHLLTETGVGYRFMTEGAERSMA
jgi:two-component system, OmpR family, KDP operon response regulator KdpE